MKLTNYIRFILALAVFLTADSVFSMANEIGNPNTFLLSEDAFNDFQTVYKKREKGLDVYTFTPKKEIDKELKTDVENRLKVMVEGFVSFSVDKKNEVKIVTDPSKTTDEEIDLVLRIVLKVYETPNYTIEEL